MTTNGWLQIALYCALTLVVSWPLGLYMARIFSGGKTWLDAVLGPIERGLYRLCGIDASTEMQWTEYVYALLGFSLISMLVLYGLERVQALLPAVIALNPQKLPNVAQNLAWNTAASFTTNTNWQSYVPESTMSYLTQMAGLAYHNFASAGAGIAVAIALVRGIARKECKTLGNFWVDMTRAILYVLLPGAIILALLLVSQGVVQNLHPYTVAHTLEGATQTIAQGPVASQEAIKEFGTNGGGFFNANSSHPFENPTPLSNLFEMIAIFAIPAALVIVLGKMVSSTSHGWAVFAAMTVLFFAGVFTLYWAEAQGNPLLTGIDQHVSATQSGGNMEGKEVRFGIANSALFANITTDTSTGAVNTMHDSLTPLGGMVPMINMKLGEVIFGGVGVGLTGMLIFVVLSVFIAGLMVGRTPEYLGKKIEAYDVQMCMLYVLIFPLMILGFSAVTLLLPKLGLSSLANAGPHGLSEILYAFTSATANNGSAFAGLNANTDYYNLSLGTCMLVGRFLMIVPVLALAGNLAQKKIVPPSAGTFPVTTPMFSALLVSVVIIVGALTFFPALALGPVLEHLLMESGKTFTLSMFLL